MPALVGIYEVIDVIQTKISGEFSWMTKTYGRALKAGVTLEDGSKVYPVVFVQNKDEADVMDQDNFDAYCFFYAKDAEELADNEEEYLAHVEQTWTRPLDLIVVYDQEKIDSSKNYPMNEEIKADLKKCIDEAAFGCGEFDIEILEIYDEPDNIFADFTYDFIERQSFKFPKGAIRFSMRAYFRKDLVGSPYTPVNTAITGMAISDDSPSVADNATMSDVTITMTPLANSYKFLFSPTDTIPAWLTLTDNGDGTASISDNGASKSTGTFTFRVIAVVNNIIADAKEINITVTGTTEITAISYTNDGQSIIAASQFSTMVGLTTPSGGTGTWSFISGGTGLAIDSSTGEITIDDFAALSTGLNSATVQFVGSGSYTGTVTVGISLTKQAEWELTDLSAGKRVWIDARDPANFLNGSGNPITTELAARDFVDQFGNVDITKTLIATDVQGITIDRDEGLNGETCLLTGFGNFEFEITGTKPTPPYSLFFAWQPYYGAGNNYLYQNVGGLGFRFLFVNTSSPILYITSSNVSDQRNITDQDQIDLSGIQVMEIRVDTTGFVKINQGEKFDWSFTMNQVDLPKIALFGQSNGSSAIGARVQQFVCIEGSAQLTGDNYDAIWARLMHDLGIQDQLPDANPYKSIMKAAP